MDVCHRAHIRTFETFYVSPGQPPKMGVGNFEIYLSGLLVLHETLRFDTISDHRFTMISAASLHHSFMLIVAVDR
jgi:hypothetical protein